MLFYITRLYYNTFTVDIQRFQADPFVLLTVNSLGYICYGVGYDNDLISLKLHMAQQFMDCAKTILKDLCDFS